MEEPIGSYVQKRSRVGLHWRRL